MNTQTNFQAANGGKRALGKHAGFQSEEEQPATKPAHTPSAGAMRAVKAILNTTAETHDDTDLAQIIDRETGHAELMAVLERCHGMFQQSPLNKDGNWLSSQLARDIRKALSNAKAQA